mgnify:CR=1 FL=1
MGLMDKAIADTVKDTKGFKKTNIEKEARIATDRQVGGDHYSKLAIQPAVYAQHNNLSYLQGTIIKYVTRYKDKWHQRIFVRWPLPCQ